VCTFLAHHSKLAACTYGTFEHTNQGCKYDLPENALAFVKFVERYPGRSWRGAAALKKVCGVELVGRAWSGPTGLRRGRDVAGQG
jgi:hypothetical protein